MGLGGWLLQIVLLDIEEVLVGAVCDLVRGGLVTHDDAVWVELQCRDGPHLVYRAFDSSVQGTALVVAVADDEHLFGSHHCAYAYGQCCGRHAVGVATKEA